MFTSIIASGGGIKILSLIGGLLALKEENILPHLKNYVGVSAGSLFVLLLLLDYQINEIYKKIKSTINYVLNEENSILNIIQENGIARGENLINLIDDYLQEKINIKNPSFKDLYHITGKTLIIGATNLVSERMEYMSYKNFPNFKVADAIRVSCSLPILFTTVNYFKILINYENKRDFYYLSSIYKNYIGFRVNTNDVYISRFKEDFKKIYAMIYYFEKKWILYSFSKNWINNVLIKDKSIIIQKKDILRIDNRLIEFISILTFADGGIIDNFPIQFKNYFDGDTIGFVFSSPKNNKDLDNNLLSYINRVKDCSLTNLLIKKMRRYKNNYINIKIPSNINSYTLELTSLQEKKLLLLGLKKTRQFINNKRFPSEYQFKSLILIDINNIKFLERFLNNNLIKKFGNQPVGLFSRYNLNHENISKYKLDTIFYYIISENGASIIKNRQKFINDISLSSKVNDYSCLINDTLYYLSKINRIIINTKFIVENKFCIEIHPYGVLTTGIDIDKDINILYRLKKKIKKKYGSEIKIIIDIDKFKIILQSKNDFKFKFLSYISESHESITVYTHSKIERIKYLKDKINNNYANKINFISINQLDN